MSDIETIIKGCENWVNNHKGKNYLLTYSSVVELLAVLKEQPEIVRCKDCRWYDEKISFCDNCNLPREPAFFCADGDRR